MSKEIVETLKFICPQCGKNELGSIESVLSTYPIIRINKDGDVDQGTPITHDSDILAYECIECGYQLQGENENTIKDCKEMVEWIEKNCSQD